MTETTRRQQETRESDGRQLREVLSQGLMRISDYQRRRILHLIKHFKSAHKQQTTFSGAHSFNGASSPAPGRLSASHAASMPHRSALAPSSPKNAIPVSSVSLLRYAYRACLPLGAPTHVWPDSVLS